jgi:hypothetical protein
MRPLRFGVLVVATLTAGCDQDGPQLPPTPVVAPASITETFTGTLAVQAPQGVVFHSFSVTTTGRIEVTLTSLGPSTLAVGLDLGLPTGLGCAAALGSDASATVQPSTTPHIRGTVLPGSYCVSIYDIGNLTDPLDYTITVAHP